MKNENPNLKNMNEADGKNSQEPKNDPKKDIRTKMQEKAAAEAKDKKKMKRNVIVAGCCAAALAVVVAAATAGLSTHKPVTPITVSNITSESAAETSDKSIRETDKDPGNIQKQENESSKEHTDDSKTVDDKKETKRDENKDPKKPETETPAVSDSPDKSEARDKNKADEKNEENAGETQEPVRIPDQEPAQETPVATPVVTETPATPVPTQAPQEDVYLPSEPVVTTAPHVHTWQERIRTVHHDAVTEQVKVVDQAAYTEPVYEEQPVYETIAVYICDVCGQEFEDVGQHSETHIDWETFTNPFHYHVEFRQGEQTGTELIQTGSITHPEVSHMETKVITAAYDEQIPEGYVCTGCGAVK